MLNSGSGVKTVELDQMARDQGYLQDSDKNGKHTSAGEASQINLNLERRLW